MMIDFERDQARFLCRTAALIIDDGHILLCQSHAAPSFWFLPGGRQEMMETSHETLRREMREELGAEIELGPLQYLVENLITLNDKPVHEIGLYYRVRLLDPALLAKDRVWNGVVDGPFKLDFRWFSLDHLDRVDVKPPFLQEALRAMPEHFQHVIHRP